MTSHTSALAWRALCMAGLWGTGLLLGAFWLPGLIVLPLCLWLWGLTFGMEPCPKLRLVRKACVLLVPVVGLVVLCLPESLLPQTVAHLRLAALDHLFLVLGLKDKLTVISELRTLSPTLMLYMLGGYAAAGALVLLALVLAVGHHPRVMLFFLPSGLALIAGAFNARFLYLAALPLALSVALLPNSVDWATQKIFHRPPSHRIRQASRAVAVLLTLCACLWPCFDATRPVYDRGLDYMAQQLKAKAVPGAKLWNWWDEGYFLQARTGLTPLFDGGSQGDEHMVPAAYPLACADPLLARRWIRFFAFHGLQAGQALRQSWGSWATVQRHLSKVLTADDPHAVLATLPPVVGLNLNHPDALLPPGQVWLYLPATFLLYNTTWKQGDQGATDAPDDLFLTRISKQTLPNLVAGKKPVTLNTSKGIMQVNTIINTSQTPLTVARLLIAEPPYLITHNDAHWWYLAGRRGAMAMGFRLLAPWGTPVPGFRELIFHPAIGGVWEVLP